jgi:hypothetical protein
VAIGETEETDYFASFPGFRAKMGREAEADRGIGA